MPRNTTVFEWGEGATTGEMGWIPKGYKDFDPTDGTFAGHDVMEHFPRHKATLADEAMAFGAMVHVRVLGDWFGGNMVQPVTALGQDMGRFLNELEIGRLVMGEPGIAPAVDRAGDYYINDIMMETLHYANIQSRNYFTRGFDENDPRLTWMEGWMRKGYAAAQRRWPHSPYELTRTFYEIGRKVGRYSRGYEEGDELHVLVDPRSLEVQVNLKEQAWLTR
ncbi:hypothetical protein [Herbaspirillum huttiense]|uniref:Uncharacterized protein n=1 Tax=Herbaspirillum huttiense subsp. lycopersici TaxID=3074428 RepID=A0ABU2EFZ5_9BURK|nr:hypothetical protein [Herbaspirillum huttiense]MDR9847064.1 hypothetical protein [Herbaspirillum huttiense SE1]